MEKDKASATWLDTRVALATAQLQTDMLLLALSEVALLVYLRPKRPSSLRIRYSFMTVIESEAEVCSPLLRRQQSI